MYLHLWITVNLEFLFLRHSKRKTDNAKCIFLVTAKLPLVGHDLLINDASRSHSVGLLWTSDQPDAEMSDSTQHSQEVYMPPTGFEPHNPSMREAADPRLRPRGHWDRHAIYIHGQMELVLLHGTQKGPGSGHSC
jgi:hypothetical protein